MLRRTRGPLLRSAKLNFKAEASAQNLPDGERGAEDFILTLSSQDVLWPGASHDSASLIHERDVAPPASGRHLLSDHVLEAFYTEKLAHRGAPCR